MRGEMHDMIRYEEYNGGVCNFFIPEGKRDAFLFRDAIFDLQGFFRKEIAFNVGKLIYMNLCY